MVLSFVRSATAWVPGEPPRALEELTAAVPPGTVWWYDLDPALASDPDEVVRVLGPVCEGLTAEMVEDLLEPDETPEGKSFDGRIRLASSFAVEVRPPAGSASRGEPQGAGELVFQPVELLASDHWLITCWHERRTFEGAKERRPRAVAAPPAVVENVARRWAGGCGRNAGDLGVLVMHELALGYVPAYRGVAGWLEDWEMAMYLQDNADRTTFARIWGSMAVLRDWINPLNRSGLRTDIERAWLCATDHDAVIGVDDRVDRALKGLKEVADALRAALQLLHIEQNEKRREEAERVQRRIELAAAAFLIPTLIVGFYGANTWVPGQGSHRGFWGMVAVLVFFTVVGLVLVRRWQAQQKRAAEEVARERRELQEQLRQRRTGPIVDG